MRNLDDIWNGSVSCFHDYNFRDLPLNQIPAQVHEWNQQIL